MAGTVEEVYLSVSGMEGEFYDHFVCNFVVTTCIFRVEFSDDTSNIFN